MQKLYFNYHGYSITLNDGSQQFQKRQKETEETIILVIAAAKEGSHYSQDHSFGVALALLIWAATIILIYIYLYSSALLP
jgi:hypothetical protein